MGVHLSTPVSSHGTQIPAAADVVSSLHVEPNMMGL